MQLFYRSDLSEKKFTLDEEESKHLVRVLRMEEGEKILLTDGKGKRCEGRITGAHPKRCEIEIVTAETEKQRDSFRLHIATAPTKNLDRMEWFVEKAVEIGIDEFSFIDCDHSERSNLKTERIEKIAIAAMKQSMRNWLPAVNALCDFRSFIRQTENFAGQKFIAHCRDGEKILLQKICAPQKDTVLLIGPEGDFSDDEISIALAHGFKAISLGESRLRTETAALVSCMTVNFVQQ